MLSRHWFRNLLNRKSKSLTRRSHIANRAKAHARLGFESLEERTLLAICNGTDIWDGGGGDDKWSTDANWVDNGAPSAAGNCALEFPSPGSPAAAQFTNTNDFVGATFKSISFTGSGGGYTISGNSITLASTATIDATNTAGTNAFNLAIALTATVAPTTVTVSASGVTLAIGGVISDSGQGVTKAGSGTLKLSAASTYSGGTTLTSGAITLGASTVGTVTSGPVGTGTFTINGGTIQSSDASRTLTNAVVVGGDFTAAGSHSIHLDGSTHLNNGPRNVAVSISSGSALFLGGLITNGPGAGAGSINKSGTGRLALESGGSTFSGGVTVSAGILSFTASSTPPSGTVTSGPAGTSTLTINGGTIGATTSTRTLANAVAVGGDFTIGAASLIDSLVLNGNMDLGGATRTVTINSSTSAATLGGVVSNGGLTKAGTGTLILSSANNYTGATTINAGTLRVSGGSAIPDSSAVVLFNGAGAVLDLNSTNETIGSLAGGGTTGGNVTLGSGTLTTGGNNTATTYSGAISGTGGLIKVGSGSVVFKLNGDSSYSGQTQVQQGTLLAASANALGSRASAAENTVVSSGASLAIIAAVGAEPVTINGTGALAGLGAFYNSSKQNNSFAGPITLGLDSTIACNGGTLTLTGTINTNGSVLTFDRPGSIAVNGAVSGAGGIIKSGTGTTTLSANSPAFTGTMAINGGTLVVNASVTSGAVTVNAGGTLKISSIGTLTASSATFSAGSTFSIQVSGTIGSSPSVGKLALGSGTLTISTTSTTLKFDLAGLSGTGSFDATIATYGSVGGSFASVTDNSASFSEDAPTYGSSSLIVKIHS